MKILDWLLQGDPVITRLTLKYLFGQNLDYGQEGLINRYLVLYDSQKRLFGGGLYSPKWISTHYTLLELKYMEVNPLHPIYQEAISHLIEKMWTQHRTGPKCRNQDICVVAMMVSMACYGRLPHALVDDMVHYLLTHQFADGGWNCDWDSVARPTKSSLHTTLSVLEAFRDYEFFGYQNHLNQIKKVIFSAQSFILRKHLFRSERTKEVISPQMMLWHYPPRWKYDAFRALEYFQSVGFPYDERMEETLDLIVKKIESGSVPKGPTISGLLHFRIPSFELSRMNTYRALKILKFYKPLVYSDLINRQFTYKN